MNYRSVEMSLESLSVLTFVIEEIHCAIFVSNDETEVKGVPVHSRWEFVKWNSLKNLQDDMINNRLN